VWDMMAAGFDPLPRQHQLADEDLAPVVNSGGPSWDMTFGDSPLARHGSDGVPLFSGFGRTFAPRPTTSLESRVPSEPPTGAMDHAQVPEILVTSPTPSSPEPSTPVFSSLEALREYPPPTHTSQISGRLSPDASPAQVSCGVEELRGQVNNLRGLVNALTQRVTELEGVEGRLATQFARFVVEHVQGSEERMIRQFIATLESARGVDRFSQAPAERVWMIPSVVGQLPTQRVQPDSPQRGETRLPARPVQPPAPTACGRFIDPRDCL
jgi:hypothetical protein